LTAGAKAAVGGADGNTGNNGDQFCLVGGGRFGVGSLFDYPVDSGVDVQDEAAFLSDATDDQWTAIRSHCELRHVHKGEDVIHQGAVDRALYILIDGRLEVLISDGRRGSRRISVIEPGMVIGEVSFFDAQPRSATVRALSDSKVLRLGFDRFEVLAAKDPILGRTILCDLGRVLATRLRTVEVLALPNLP
jgi:CRP-like cAMP-binding protein